MNVRNLTQRIKEVSKALQTAKDAGDQDLVEELEDELYDLEFDLEEEINNEYQDQHQHGWY